MKIDDRYYWALEKLSLSPGDQVLEIGFGSGILLELMANHPSKVLVTGIDRSRAGAARVNKVVQSAGGRVKVIYDPFPDVSLPPGRYSKIVAFNVPFFRKESSPEMAALKPMLARDGRVFVFYQNPGEVSEEDVNRIAQGLAANGLVVVDSGFGPGRQKKWLFVVASR